MGNQHTDNEPTNGNAFSSRRELRNSHITGVLPIPGISGDERNGTWPSQVGGGFDFEQMIASLRDLFEHDRQIASQSDSTRCGICYLHFALTELQYRDEGFYLCPDCAYTLGHHALPMLRQQQKM